MTTAKPYTLDCSHVVYLSVAPTATDKLWCVKCQRYEPLMFSATSGRTELIDAAGEFRVIRLGSKLVGQCLYEKDGKQCETTVIRTTYIAIQNNMHSHYIKAHTRFGSLKITQGTKKLPRNSPPPF